MGFLLIIPVIRVESQISYRAIVAIRRPYKTAALVLSLAALPLGNIPAVQAAIVDKCMEEAARGKISPEQLARSFQAASELHVTHINRRQLQNVTLKIVYPIEPPTQLSAGFPSPLLISKERWNVLIASVNLASSLEPMPTLPPESSDLTWGIEESLPKDDPAEPRFVTYGRTDRKDEQAHLQLPGVPLNEGRSVGPQYIVAIGGAIDLDRCDLARVIFKDVRIEYHGNLTSLREVKFVHCTFKIEDVWALSAYRLVKKLLAGGSITFPG
jgi:hypothetical protein